MAALACLKIKQQQKLSHLDNLDSISTALPVPSIPVW
jgi:hypothetical protein